MKKLDAKPRVSMGAMKKLDAKPRASMGATNHTKAALCIFLPQFM